MTLLPARDAAAILRVIIAVLLALVIGFVVGVFGWRANITFEPNPVRYVPVPVRDTLATSHWYLRDWPYRWER